MSPIPSWSNQALQLFHGTTLRSARNIVDHGIDVAAGKPDCDFGKGFYCTTSEAQAQDWSKIKAARERDEPAVVSIQVPREVMGRLTSLVFVRGDQQAVDYWSLVLSCRSLAFSRAGILDLPYDVVYGPVALLWFEQKAKPNSDQICFHSTAAQKMLNTETKRGMLST